MDKLLSSFVLKYINDLNEKQLNVLENFLNIDDESLYKYKQGLKTEFQVPKNKITKLFKNYKI